MISSDSLNMIAESNSIQDIKTLCEEFVEGLGIDFFMFAVRTPTSFSTPRIETMTNYPDEWVNTYFSANLHKCDPVVQHCLENNAPVYWSDLYADTLPEESSVNVIKLAQNSGVSDGYSIPLHSPNGSVAIFSFANKEGNPIGDISFNAYSFATQVFEAYMRINDSSSLKTKLTTRELECLFWACEGKTTWEISKILDISERTVVFHLSCSTKKLGASNRQHAVAKAITFGYIKPNMALSSCTFETVGQPLHSVSLSL